jgi:hypothetical protein
MMNSRQTIGTGRPFIKYKSRLPFAQINTFPESIGFIPLQQNLLTDLRQIQPLIFPVLTRHIKNINNEWIIKQNAGKKLSSSGIKMAAKLGNLRVFYGKKAGGLLVFSLRVTKCFFREANNDRLLQGINYPHRPLWHSLCFKKRMPISISKSKKIVSSDMFWFMKTFFSTV